MNPEPSVKTHSAAHHNSLQRYHWDASLLVSGANDSLIIISFLFFFPPKSVYSLNDQYGFVASSLQAAYPFLWMHTRCIACKFMIIFFFFFKLEKSQMSSSLFLQEFTIQKSPDTVNIWMDIVETGTAYCA